MVQDSVFYKTVFYKTLFYKTLNRVYECNTTAFESFHKLRRWKTRAKRHMPLIDALLLQVEEGIQKQQSKDTDGAGLHKIGVTVILK